MITPKKIENDSVIDGWVKPVTGRDNILYHVVLQVDIEAIRNSGNPTLASLEDVVALAEAVDTPKPEHTYYSIYDENGLMLKTNFPFLENGME